MGLIGGTIGYRLLKLISSNGDSKSMDGSAYLNKSKLETLLGPKFWNEIENKAVIDVGCGNGVEAIEMARRGARSVIGVDTQEEFIQAAKALAVTEGVAERCDFLLGLESTGRADVITAIDSFEHFDNPALILQEMSRHLKPQGCVLTAFGPTWYHPLGGHLFSVFPWAHLIFTEKSLIRWRSDFKSDGAASFREVAGGLNQMTIKRFVRIVGESPFRFDEFEAVPIRKLSFLSNQLTREFTTAIVRCKLVLK